MHCVHEGFQVSVINPAQAHHFAKALLKRAKTDAIDAQTLAQLAIGCPKTPFLGHILCPVFGPGHIAPKCLG
jgi:hypothetical protein